MDDNATIAKLISDRIDSFENTVTDRFDRIETEVREIRKQTTRTNGRVTRAEFDIGVLQESRSSHASARRFRITTAIAVIACVSVPAVEVIHLFT